MALHLQRAAAQAERKQTGVHLLFLSTKEGNRKYARTKIITSFLYFTVCTTGCWKHLNICPQESVVFQQCPFSTYSTVGYTSSCCLVLAFITTESLVLSYIVEKKEPSALKDKLAFIHWCCVWGISLNPELHYKVKLSWVLHSGAECLTLSCWRRPCHCAALGGP